MCIHLANPSLWLASPGLQLSARPCLPLHPGDSLSSGQIPSAGAGSSAIAQHLSREEVSGCRGSPWTRSLSVCCGAWSQRGDNGPFPAWFGPRTDKILTQLCLTLPGGHLLGSFTLARVRIGLWAQGLGPVCSCPVEPGDKFLLQTGGVPECTPSQGYTLTLVPLAAAALPCHEQGCWHLGTLELPAPARLWTDADCAGCSRALGFSL